jgi:hypothetical protein
MYHLKKEYISANFFELVNLEKSIDPEHMHDIGVGVIKKEPCLTRKIPTASELKSRKFFSPCPIQDCGKIFCQRKLCARHLNWDHQGIDSVTWIKKIWSYRRDEFLTEPCALFYYSAENGAFQLIKGKKNDNFHKVLKACDTTEIPASEPESRIIVEGIIKQDLLSGNGLFNRKKAPKISNSDCTTKSRSRSKHLNMYGIFLYPCPIRSCGLICSDFSRRKLHFASKHPLESWEFWSTQCENFKRVNYSTGNDPLYIFAKHRGTYQLRSSKIDTNFYQYINYDFTRYQIDLY